MEKMLFSIKFEGGMPSIEQICEKYGFLPEEIDPEFGVISIDPEDDLYSILVDQSAAQRIQTGISEDIEGPFSNPQIGPFGPPSE